MALNCTVARKRGPPHEGPARSDRRGAELLLREPGRSFRSSRHKTVPCHYRFMVFSREEILIPVPPGFYEISLLKKRSQILIAVFYERKKLNEKGDLG